MKLSALKEAISVRLLLLKASIIYTWQTETAYGWSFFGRCVGSFIYTATTVVFINLLYTRVTSIAGYSQGDMFIFYLVGQLSLFTTVQFSFDNILDLITRVNNGGLDLILSKPLPALFYVSTKSLSIFSLLADELPSLLILYFVLQGQNFTILLPNLLAAIFVFICGFLCMHVIQFLSALPVFWIGESRNLLDATWAFEYSVGRIIPYEGFSAPWQFIFSTLIPCLITTGLTTSVLLGKSNALSAIILCTIVTFIALTIKRKMWDIALLNYTSASS